MAELAASAIPPALAEAAGWHTETDAAVVVKNLHWSKAAERHVADRLPALAIPYPDLDGNPTDHVRYKMTRPREEKRDDGKVRAVKYESPKGRPNRLYFPPCLAARLADPDARILITEGEKKVLAAMAADDALACLGLSGVWSWRKDGDPIPDLSLIDWDGRTVYLVFDSDAASNESVAGARFALARALAKLGATVLAADIPPGPADADGQPGKVGLDDYIVGGGKLADLLNAATEPKDLDPRPVVYPSPDLHRTVDKVCKVLAAVPNVYSRGNVLVRADRGGGLHPIPADALPVEVSRHVRFEAKKERADGTVEKRQVPPPVNVSRGVFADPRAPIREVVAVVSYPTMLPGGRILSAAGYDPDSRLLVAAPAPVQVSVPDRPTAADARRAAGVLLDVFDEFPFPPGADGERSKSAVLSLILTLIARPMIGGATPFILVQKNAPAAGGSLIIKAVWRIVAGTDLPMVSYSHDDDELRKVLTSLVLEGRSAGAMDNIDGEFGTPSLCRFVTSDVWADRVLRLSKMMEAVNRLVLFGSSNNAVLLREMPRRTVTIDLHTDEEHPEQAEKRRPDLIGHIDARRGELLSAAFVILKAWVVAGRPQPADPLPHFGSFEAWSQVIRAALVYAGQPDPFAPTASRDDHRRRLLHTVAVGLREMDPAGNGLTAAQIVKQLNGADYQAAAIGDMADALAELAEKLTAVGLGRLLAQARGRNLGGIRFVEVARDQRKNLAKWKAELVAPPAGRTDKREQGEGKTPPEYPANGGTSESLFAGDSGGKSGVPLSRAGFPPSGDPRTDPVAFETLLQRRGWGWLDVGKWLDGQDDYAPIRPTFSDLTDPQKRKVIAHLDHLNGKAVAK